MKKEMNDNKNSQILFARRRRVYLKRDLSSEMWYCQWKQIHLTTVNQQQVEFVDIGQCFFRIGSTDLEKLAEEEGVGFGFGSICQRAGLGLFMP